MANLQRATKQQRHGLFSGGKTPRDYPEYQVWIGIIQRCYDPNMNVYRYYGGRGIQMAGEWRHDFLRFLEDVGRRPSADHQLDRVDNDRNYEPGNVRWVTRKEQCRNRRSNHSITIGGVTLPLAAWLERYPISRSAVHKRIKAGWSAAEAITTPARTPRNSGL